MCPYEKLTRVCEKCGTKYSFSREDVIDGPGTQSINSTNEDIDTLLWLSGAKKEVNIRYVKCPACGEREILSVTPTKISLKQFLIRCVKKIVYILVGGTIAIFGFTMMLVGTVLGQTNSLVGMIVTLLSLVLCLVGLIIALRGKVMFWRQS